MRQINKKYLLIACENCLMLLDIYSFSIDTKITITPSKNIEIFGKIIYNGYERSEFDMKRELISVIIPCYNEQEAIPLYYKEMSKIMEEMKDNDFELLFVLLFLYLSIIL